MLMLNIKGEVRLHKVTRNVTFFHFRCYKVCLPFQIHGGLMTFETGIFGMLSKTQTSQTCFLSLLSRPLKPNPSFLYDFVTQLCPLSPSTPFRRTLWLHGLHNNHWIHWNTELLQLNSTGQFPNSRPRTHPGSGLFHWAHCASALRLRYHHLWPLSYHRGDGDSLPLPKR